MRLLRAPLLLLLAACADTPVMAEDETPLTGVDGVADVAGQVLSASGAPITGNVTISCGGGAFGATVPADAQGHYHAFLAAPGTGRVLCEFTSAGIRTHASIGFGPRGVPHVLQIVNLRDS